MSREANISLDPRYYGVCCSVSGDRLSDRARCPARRRDRERVGYVEAVDCVNFGDLREFWREFRSDRAGISCRRRYRGKLRIEVG